MSLLKYESHLQFSSHNYCAYWLLDLFFKVKNVLKQEAYLYIRSEMSQGQGPQPVWKDRKALVIPKNFFK